MSGLSGLPASQMLPRCLPLARGRALQTSARAHVADLHPQATGSAPAARTKVSSSSTPPHRCRVGSALSRPLEVPTVAQYHTQSSHERFLPSSSRDSSSSTGHHKGNQRQPTTTGPTEPNLCTGSGGGSGSMGSSNGGGGGPGGWGGGGPWGTSDGDPSEGALTAWLPAVLIGCIAGAQVVSGVAPGQAAAARDRDGLIATRDQNPLDRAEVDGFVERLWGMYSPLVKTMGLSGFLGACAAAAVKWVSRTLVATLGLLFVTVQLLQHRGVITVDWQAVNETLGGVVGRHEGWVNQDDVKRAAKRGLAAISEGVPNTTGFLVGFMVGLRVF